ncbi:MAG: primosomal protein N' [Cyanobacteria bacterium P01_A01_bin.45]
MIFDKEIAEKDCIYQQEMIEIDSVSLLSKVVSESSSFYNSATNNHQWIEVLVDVPGNSGIYTYKLPSRLEIKPGDILSVPFGSQILGGIAIRLLSNPNADIPIEKIREVEDVVSVGFFPPLYWELLNRVASYYYTPLIGVIRIALPPGLLGRSQRRIRLARGIENSLLSSSFELLSPVARSILDLLEVQKDGDYSFVYLQRQVKGAYRGVRELIRRGLVESYLEAPKSAKPKLQKAVILVNSFFGSDLTPRQREILVVLQRCGGELWQTELLQACHTSSSTLKALVNKAYIVLEEREKLRKEVGDNSGETPTQQKAKSLTPHQNEALKNINNLDGYATVLLHGVTGSGKTEVYLQAISPLLKMGKSALVLVPEIGLTPQLTDRFRDRFGDKVSVYHSALSEGERYDTWRQMLTGEAQVVIGTRSAVFAPLPKLGLIVLDEEHDSSFKQDTPAPTYHARVVAQWRAELEDCPLILGSATPSLESWVNAQEKQFKIQNSKYPTGTFSTNKIKEQDWETETDSSIIHSPSSIPHHQYLSLPERINSRPLPPIKIVDMRLELQQGNKSIFSKPLVAALRELKDKGQQGILFIHRRGHSTFVSCRSCGFVMECPNCDVSLAYHHTQAGKSQLLRCHYCGYTRSHPPNCPECSSPYLKFFGSGTQRVTQELSKKFPQLRHIRFDSDTTRTKGAHRNLLKQFTNGEADLLVGTQMLTKGLDLPQVTLVGVIAADGLLHLSDYRASERAFQTLTQVAGRAGRGEDPGKVIVQTYTPEHPVIEAVRHHDYLSFSTKELEERQALDYPPYGRLILLRLSSPDSVQVQKTAEAIAKVLEEGNTEEGNENYEVLGPAPANIMRVANRYRWQILIKFSSKNLPKLPDWEEIRKTCHQSVSLTIDVDPLNMM